MIIARLGRQVCDAHAKHRKLPAEQLHTPVIASPADARGDSACGTGCCAEFVASRQRIKARPKQFYINLMERLDALGPDDESSPYAVEHLWHAIFVSIL